MSDSGHHVSLSYKWFFVKGIRFDLFKVNVSALARESRCPFFLLVNLIGQNGGNVYGT